MTTIWCMVHEIWSTTDRTFCHFRPFLHFYHPNNPKKQNFEKMKKQPGDIITFHMCNINGKHIMYRSWYIKSDGQNFLSFWTIFCPFTHLTTWKIKIWKTEDKSWRYYHFTDVYHKWQSYNVWFLRYQVWQTKVFVILEHILPFYPANPKNKNFEKMKKKAWRYYHFTPVYHKWQSPDVWFQRYEVWSTNFVVILDHFFALLLL